VKLRDKSRPTSPDPLSPVGGLKNLGAQGVILPCTTFPTLSYGGGFSLLHWWMDAARASVPCPTCSSPYREDAKRLGRWAAALTPKAYMAEREAGGVGRSGQETPLVFAAPRKLAGRHHARGGVAA
jgi:hypothetical protein